LGVFGDFFKGIFPLPPSSEVLAEAGFSMEECAEARHVILEGLDIEPDSSMFEVRFSF
jgi:hypothetical protein